MNSKLYKLAKMVLQLAEMETDKGILISDAEIEVGREVFVEDENGELVAAPDGEYKESNGDRIFVVVDGKVAEIKEPELEDAPADPEPEPEPEAEEPVEEPLEEEEPAEEAEEPEAEEPVEDEKDKRIAELEAQIEELNNIIVEKDAEIGKLKAELERSDAEPAEEQLKSQKENKSWFKPRF